MNGQSIINHFQLYVDDQADLSSVETLALMNKWYRRVLENRPWSFLKSTFTGTATGADYIDLPSDFGYILENDLTNRLVLGSQERKTVVFVGDDYEPYAVIPFSERRAVRTLDNYCWVDIKQNRLYFSKAPTSGKQIEYDYIYVPDALTLSTSPVFPDRFHDVVYHGMATDHNVIEQSEKAQSYREENAGLYESYMTDMAYWDSINQYNG